MHQPIRRGGTVCACCLLLAATACGGGGDSERARDPYLRYGHGTWPVPHADNALAADHARAQGQYSFVWDTFGAEYYDNFPPVDFVRRVIAEEPEVFGNQLARFGFLADPDDEFPVGLKRGTRDPSRLMYTCVTCHVARLPDGRTWIGAPNDALDLAGLRLALNERWVAAGNATMFGALSQQKMAQIGPGRGTGDPGDYPQVITFDTPSFWTLGDRVHLGAMGIERDVRTSSYLALYLGTDVGRPNDETTKVPYPPLDRLGAMIDYLANLEPPAPPAQDVSLVARGREVFTTARCDACHHVDAVGDNGVVTVDDSPEGRERLPGEDEAFPNGSIRTNALVRVLQDGDGSGEAAFDLDVDLIKFILRHDLVVIPTDGYRVTDLRGLWASAPYLHNGSVPTLEDLLKPRAQRPVSWDHRGFTLDTRLPHNGNEGHEFGVELPEADRTALVAYLKSL
jgi:hypothetical protein